VKGSTEPLELKKIVPKFLRILHFEPSGILLLHPPKRRKNIGEGK
jgi:hypothetical protein